MRLAPVAVRFWNDRPRLIATAAEQSRCTHGAEGSGGRLPGVRGAACRRHRGGLHAPRSSPRDGSRERRRSPGSWPAAFAGAPGTRSTPAAMSWTPWKPPLWSVARTGNFRNAVLLAANLADDADTVAAVAGAARRRSLRPGRHPRHLAGTGRLEGSTPRGGAAAARAVARRAGASQRIAETRGPGIRPARATWGGDAPGSQPQGRPDTTPDLQLYSPPSCPGSCCCEVTRPAHNHFRKAARTLHLTCNSTVRRVAREAAVVERSPPAQVVAGQPSSGQPISGRPWKLTGHTRGATPAPAGRQAGHPGTTPATARRRCEARWWTR